MKPRSIPILVVLAVQALHLASAQEITLKLATDRPDAIYPLGAEVVFTIGFACDPASVRDAPRDPLDDRVILPDFFLDAVIEGDGGLKRTEKLKAGAENRLTVKGESPGWIRLTLTVRDAAGAEIRNVKGHRWIGAMVAPELLRAAQEEPEDFDAFWTAVRREVDAVPLQAVATPATNLPPAAAVVCYDVQVPCAGGQPVSGYLALPTNAAPKSLPIVISFHGAGVRSASQPLAMAAAGARSRGAIAFDVNAHGLPNGRPPEFYQTIEKTALNNYPRQGKTSRDTFYFKGMYMRVLRALAYAKTRPEWDGRTLLVYGGSQGGAQTMVAAALDPDVSFCLVTVPALCDHAGSLATPRRRPGWPQLYWADAGGRVPEADAAVMRTAAYYDGVFFARRIRCEAFFATGFTDNVCPPSGVYAAFNALPSGTRKAMTTNPVYGHNATNDKGSQRLREILAQGQ